MANEQRQTIEITVVALDPPFSEGDPVLFGLQRKREVDEPKPATGTTEFRCEVQVLPGGSDSYDFRGDFVHGKKGDRFLYLSWGLTDPEQPFAMFARAKINLTKASADLVRRAVEGEVLVCHVEATNPKGQPASGTINKPHLRWSVES